MNNFLLYLLESSIYLSVFYGFYLILLKRDSFFTRNRLYLLIAYLGAMLLPFIDISFPDYAYNVNMEKLVPSDFLSSTVALTQNSSDADRWSCSTVIAVCYMSITGFFLVVFLQRVIRMLLLITKGKKKRTKKRTYIISENISEPFSFFGFIFLEPEFSIRKLGRAVILHESGHIQYKHTLDILISEVIKILMWFNPVVWMMHRSLAEVHEYQADAYVLNRGIPRAIYQKILIHNASNSSQLIFVHPFHGTTLKRRLLMMQKKNTKAVEHIKLAVLIPVLLLMLTINPVDAEDNKFILPLAEGRITSTFGMRIHPISKNPVHHNGIDIAAPRGTEVTATAGGIVIRTGEEKGPGKYILLQHENGWHSFYSQLESIDVEADQIVTKGEHIGTVGSSGISTAPHLHFELRLNAEPVDPENHIDFSPLIRN